MLQAIGLKTHDYDHGSMACIVRAMWMMGFPSTDRMVGRGIFLTQNDTGKLYIEEWFLVLTHGKCR
jgi:hypothetical protein